MITNAKWPTKTFLMAKYCLIALNDICSYHIRYGYLDGLDDVDLSLSGLIGSSKQVKQAQTFKQFNLQLIPSVLVCWQSLRCGLRLPVLLWAPGDLSHFYLFLLVDSSWWLIGPIDLGRWDCSNYRKSQVTGDLDPDTLAHLVAVPRLVKAFNNIKKLKPKSQIPSPKTR